jgi:hypothetical protein
VPTQWAAAANTAALHLHSSSSSSNKPLPFKRPFVCRATLPGAERGGSLELATQRRRRRRQQPPVLLSGRRRGWHIGGLCWIYYLELLGLMSLSWHTSICPWLPARHCVGRRSSQVGAGGRDKTVGRRLLISDAADIRNGPHPSNLSPLCADSGAVWSGHWAHRVATVTLLAVWRPLIVLRNQSRRIAERAVARPPRPPTRSSRPAAAS